MAVYKILGCLFFGVQLTAYGSWKTVSIVKEDPLPRDKVQKVSRFKTDSFPLQFIQGRTLVKNNGRSTQLIEKPVFLEPSVTQPSILIYNKQGNLRVKSGLFEVATVPKGSVDRKTVVLKSSVSEIQMKWKNKIIEPASDIEVQANKVNFANVTIVDKPLMIVSDPELDHNIEWIKIIPQSPYKASLVEGVIDFLEDRYRLNAKWLAVEIKFRAQK